MLLAFIHLELKCCFKFWNCPNRKSDKFNLEVFSYPIVCLDGDKSGQMASLRIAENLLPHIKENNKIGFVNISNEWIQMIILKKKVR